MQLQPGFTHKSAMTPDMGKSQAESCGQAHSADIPRMRSHQTATEQRQKRVACCPGLHASALHTIICPYAQGRPTSGGAHPLPAAAQASRLAWQASAARNALGLAPDLMVQVAVARPAHHANQPRLHPLAGHARQAGVAGGVLHRHLQAVSPSSRAKRQLQVMCMHMQVSGCLCKTVYGEPHKLVTKDIISSQTCCQ